MQAANGSAATRGLEVRGGQAGLEGYRCSPAPLHPVAPSHPLLSFPVPRLAAMDSDLTQEELEAQVEEFMRKQAEIESGSATRKAEPGKVLGADEVSEEVSWAGLGARCWVLGWVLTARLCNVGRREGRQDGIEDAASCAPCVFVCGGGGLARRLGWRPFRRRPPGSPAAAHSPRPRRRPSASAARWWGS